MEKNLIPIPSTSKGIVKWVFYFRFLRVVDHFFCPTNTIVVVKKAQQGHLLAEVLNLFCTICPLHLREHFRGSFPPSRNDELPISLPKRQLQLLLPQKTQDYFQIFIPPWIIPLWIVVLWRVLQVHQNKNKKSLYPTVIALNSAHHWALCS